MRRTLPIATFAAAALCQPAAAAVPHTVVSGETLWSIAAASNLTTRTLAAYNGLSQDARVVLGSTIMVPSPAEGYTALQRAGLVASPPTAAPPASPHSHAPGATGSASGAGQSQAPAGTGHSHAPAPLGAYTVRPGDTLSGLAATARVPLAHIAAMNGLDPARPLLAGTVIKLPAGTPTPERAKYAPPPAPVVPPAAPRPTPDRVTADEIAAVARAHGVPAPLAAAIAWQESGFDNSRVSVANARGVMQVMPGTWDWVQANLARQRLDPASAMDNIHAGVMYLRRLLDEAGGDEAVAVAGYYQGLGSVRSRGMFDDTRRYVANVRALEARFGG